MSESTMSESTIPRYHVLSHHELSSGMQSMADRIRSIATVSLNMDMSDDDQRDIIVPLLDGIEHIAADLDGENSVTNYSVINRYMGAFLYDVGLAREFALRDPPNLVPSQRLIKSCLSCHESI